MTLADRIVLLKDGAIEQDGAPLDLFERPRSRFVAGFLGSPQMNFIPCRLEGERLYFAGGETLALDGGRPAAPTGLNGRELLFGVRPEHLSRDGSGRPGLVPITAHIDLVQPTGTRTFVQFRFGGVEVTAELPAHTVERPGETIRLAVDMPRTILIDPSTDLVIR
jgi:multiple sugar transport system ATP-binding protein